MASNRKRRTRVRTQNQIQVNSPTHWKKMTRTVNQDMIVAMRMDFYKLKESIQTLMNSWSNYYTNWSVNTLSTL